MTQPHPEDQPINGLPSLTLLLIALLQGLVLLLLHQAIDLKYWPYPNISWLYGLYALFLSGPTIALLVLNGKNTKKALAMIVPFSFFAGVCAFYIGNQTLNVGYGGSAILLSMVVTLFIAAFKATMYIQQYIDNKKISYQSLFIWSWRNFLTLNFSMLFSCIFFGILMLCAQLFKTINVHFFYDIFTEKWFFYPVLALANGFAIILIRNMLNVIDTISRLQQLLMKYLLVLLVAIALLFLCTLLFTGFNNLWDKGGSALIFWLQISALFFLNAVYQGSPENRPYSLLLHRFIYIGIAALPIYSAISFYGLFLRISQYGLSVERLWALLIWLLLALLSACYLYGIVKKRDNWIGFMSVINIRFGLGVLAIMLLVNTPLLDFRKMTVNNQLARIAKGDTTLDALDTYYFARQLHKPGVDALKKLKTQYEKSNPTFAIKVEKALSGKRTKPTLTRNEFTKYVNIIEGNPPETLINALYKKHNNTSHYSRGVKYHLLELNLSTSLDPSPTQFLTVTEQQYSQRYALWFLEGTQWKRAPIQAANYSTRQKESFEKLKRKEFEVLAPKWKTLKIGETQYQIMEK